jgi:hypothetical protein
MKTRVNDENESFRDTPELVAYRLLSVLRSSLLALGFSYEMLLGPLRAEQRKNRTIFQYKN